MATNHPCIRFNDGKCREAMSFYKEVFSGELEFMTVKGSPMESDFPEDRGDYIMHSTLKNGDFLLIGSDMLRDTATIGDNMAISINCTSEEEIQAFFAKLSEGGEIFCPLGDQFWGAMFGVIIDKYGIEWMLNYGKIKVEV